MAFNIDDWIPNFTLFVLYLAPLILFLIAGFVIVSRFYNLRRGEKKTKKYFVDYVGYLPALYLIAVIYEIGEYLFGIRETIADRLFLYHFPIFMFLTVVAGIFQVCWYWLFMGPKGEVRG